MIDRGGHVVAIGPCPAEERLASRRDIHASELCEHSLDLDLARVRGQIEMGPLRGERHVGEKRIDGRRADFLEHRLAIVRGEGKITHDYNPLMNSVY